MRWGEPTTSRASYARLGATPPRARVTFRIDGGYESAYTTALPILSTLGLPASLHPTVDRIGQAGWMDAAQLLEVQAAGWAVGSHGRSNLVTLTELTPEEQWAELAGSKSDLEALGLTVREFSPQSNSWNAGLALMAREAGYAVASTGFGNAPHHVTYPLADAYNLKRGPSINSNDHTAADVIGWVRSAVAAKGWLTLLFHHVRDTGDSLSASVALFAEVARFVAASGVDVVTLYDGLWGTPQPPTLYPVSELTWATL